MKHLKILLFLFLTLTIVAVSNCQIYDVLITESFNNTTNMTTSASFGGSISSSTCGNANMFNVTSDSRALDCVHYEPSSSVFVCSDKDAVGAGTGTVSVEMLTYTAVDNDEIGFVGYLASYDFNTLETAEVVELFYSINNGSTYTSFLVLTGDATDNTSYSANGTGDGFSCSDGSASVQTEFINKEFSIGSNLSGQTIKIKVEFSGFTSANEGVVLDEFSLVKVRNILASEDFDNTTSLTTTNSVFSTSDEAGGCNSMSLYDCTANMAAPSNALGCLGGEDGDVFVMTGGGVATGEELELLTYTATDNAEISFRGNFASFGSDQNTDNFIVVAYSTDNGVNYTDAFTVRGIDGGSGTDWHSVSDGTSTVGRSFIKKGFVIGSNLTGSIIKVKVTYDTYTNVGDGIALDKFRLEGSLITVLPIELLDFSPKLNGEEVYLDWTTSTEVNNDYFTIQRSKDASSFEDLGIVNGAGNSNDLLKYNYIDDGSELSGIVYYRLKQTDFDGKTSYSKIKSVDLSSLAQNKWSIYPNPAKNILNIEGNIVKVEIRNLLGEVIETNSSEKFLINLSKVLSGTYFVKVWFEDGGLDIKKLIVNH
jgi:hypothetical protein